MYSIQGNYMVSMGTIYSIKGIVSIVSIVSEGPIYGI